MINLFSKKQYANTYRVVSNWLCPWGTLAIWESQCLDWSLLPIHHSLVKKHLATAHTVGAGDFPAPACQE